MSSFFTTPASQRKRKRTDPSSAPTSKKRNTSTAPIRSSNGSSNPRKEHEDSISGSDSELASDDVRDEPEDSEEDSSDEDETAADRRRRLAERYLDKLKSEVVVDEAGFDAEEIDRELIAARLKEDVAETKGKVYRFVAQQLDLDATTASKFHSGNSVVTGVAIATEGESRLAYTCTKNGEVMKWDLAVPAHARPQTEANGLPAEYGSHITQRRKPKLLTRTRGTDEARHTGSILSIAVSASNKFLATGSRDKSMIVWDCSTLTPLKRFTHHRDAVAALSFRPGTHTLFSASADRSVKVWSLDELAYVETLFGHQDHVVDIKGMPSIGGRERCISVGARDRTATCWKVDEGTYMPFRGGGVAKKKKTLKSKEMAIVNGANGTHEEQEEDEVYAEGSIDRLCILDAETFVTASDNGSLSLWSIHRKKPIHIIPLAHGVDPPVSSLERYPEEDPEIAKSHGPAPKNPRWITALASVMFTDIVVSGSWDGRLRLWRVSEDRRKLEPVGAVGGESELDPLKQAYGEKVGGDCRIDGIVNDLSVFERGDRGRDGVCVIAGVGKEHRLGSWRKWEGKNTAVVMEIPKKSLDKKQETAEDDAADAASDAE